MNDKIEKIEAIKSAPKSEELLAQLDPELSRLAEMKGKLSTNVANQVKDSRLAESYREYERSKQKYSVDINQYTDENARKVVQAVLDSGLGDNSNAFHHTVDFIANLATKNPDLGFDLTNNKLLKGTVHYKAGMTTNGYKVTDENGTRIVLNVDSPNALRTVVGHEFTHVLEGTELYGALADTVLKYCETKEGLDNLNARIKEAEGKYKGDTNTTPEKEVVADLIGEYVFTDYEFINNLCNTNHEGFLKLFDEIKYMARIATAGSKEARDLARVKNDFEKVFREYSQGNSKAENGVQNSLSIKHTDGTVEELADARSLTDKQAVDYLYQAKSGALRGETYIPVRKDTPQVIIDTMEQVDERIENRSLVMQVRKAQQAMTAAKSGRRAVRYGSNVRGHALNAEQIVEILNNLDEPSMMVYQTNRKDVNGNPLPNNVAVFVEYNKEGTEGVAVIEFDSTIDPESIGTEYGDTSYHTVVTVFEPDVERDGFAFDYAEELLSNPDNIELKIQRRQSAGSATRTNQSNTSNELPSFDAKVSQDGSKVNSQYSLSRLDNAYQEDIKIGDLIGAELAVEQAANLAMPDSKIRDESGMLIPVYHGTKEMFYEFDTSVKGGENGTAEGYGIYTSDSQEVTEVYGDRQIKMYANITKPATSTEKTITPKTLATLIKDTCQKQAQQMVNDGEYDSVADALMDTWVSNYVYTYDIGMERAYREVAKSILQMNDSDMAVVQEVMSGMAIRDYEAAMDFYNNSLIPITGIDGYVTEWKNSATGKTANIYIAFNSNQLKSADAVTKDDNGNVIPLSQRFNPEKQDIRYSRSDSDGKKLTEAQIDYFIESKMRDENGNLKVMYHGSKDAGFHIFDSGMSDDDISFFFVDRNDVAASYSGTTETYEARTIRSAEDMNNFLAEIGYDHYTAVEKNGKFELLENNEHVAWSDTAKGIYEEFCWYEGVGDGDANYKVYLNLKNPLIVDAEGRNWDNVSQEYWPELYEQWKNDFTEEEKAALIDLAGWEDYSTFKAEVERCVRDAGKPTADEYTKAINSAYWKHSDMSSLFSIAADNFSDEVLKAEAIKQMTTRDYAQRAKEQGYDGVIFKNIVDIGEYGADRTPATVAIAFDSNQIKSVRNENPTSDPDIRFSISEDTQGRQLTNEQQSFFQYAKTTDELGRLKPFYHGTARADRVGTVFDPSRATSGPMAFFTDNRQIADNYARDKADTSLEYDEMYDDYYTQFRTEINGKNMSVSEAWKYLPASKKAEIREKAKHVKMDEDYENVIYDENEQYGVGGFVDGFSLVPAPYFENDSITHHEIIRTTSSALTHMEVLYLHHFISIPLQNLTHTISHDAMLCQHKFKKQGSVQSEKNINSVDKST